MSQDPGRPDTSEGTSGKSEDNQQDNLDNSEQSSRKKIRQNTPSPSRGNTPQGKQNY